LHFNRVSLLRKGRPVRGSRLSGSKVQDLGVGKRFTNSSAAISRQAEP
jgi:hypothetical protein